MWDFKKSVQLCLKQDMILSFIKLLYTLLYYGISRYSSERDLKKFILIAI